MLRICFICTHSFTLATLCRGLFPWLEARGYEISAVVGDTEYVDLDPLHFGTVRPVVIPMRRTPHLGSDAAALLQLLRFLRRGRFDILHVSTPKASLFGAIAGRLTGIPVIYVYRTCVYDLQRGWRRWIHMRFDRAVAALSSRVVPVSRYFENLLIKEVGVPQGKIRFIASGGSNGVDTERFHPAAVSSPAVAETRAALDIEPGSRVLLYLGRLSREKGIDALLPMLDEVRARVPDTVLVVAGPHDSRDVVSRATLAALDNDPGVRRLPYVENPGLLYGLADVLVFPSHREGIPNVLLEAASHQRAVVAFLIPGVDEVVVDGVTGILVEFGDVSAMSQGVIRLLENSELAAALARNARDRAITRFASPLVWQGLEKVLSELASPAIRAPQ